MLGHNGLVYGAPPTRRREVTFASKLNNIPGYYVLEHFPSRANPCPRCSKKQPYRPSGCNHISNRKVLKMHELAACGMSWTSAIAETHYSTLGSVFVE